MEETGQLGAHLEGPPHSPTPIRLAIVSTPRSGNTWLRLLVKSMYQIPTLGFHSIKPEEWEAMPQEVVYQHHWHRTEEYLSQLRANRFRVLTIARHPLDVLISILHVVIYDVQSESWLLGGSEAGERRIWGAMPRSRPFIEYALSDRAKELLQVTCEWWKQPDVVSVRYEDLVADTHAELLKVADQIGPARIAFLEDAIAQNTIGELAKTSLNNHFWKGRPNLWRELLTQAEVEEIYPSLQEIFETLGYSAEADPKLTASAADANWIRYVGEEFGQTVRQQTAGHIGTLCKYEEQQRVAERERDQALAQLAELQNRVSSALACLAPPVAVVSNITEIVEPPSLEVVSVPEPSAETEICETEPTPSQHAAEESPTPRERFDEDRAAA